MIQVSDYVEYNLDVFLDSEFLIIRLMDSTYSPYPVSEEKICLRELKEKLDGL